MKEGEIFLLAEVAGEKPKEVPITHFQKFYLETVIDPEVQKLCDGIDLEITRRKLSDEYQQRTIPQLH